MRIPRVIHRVWLGDKEMPDEYVRFGRSWAEHHPDWEMRLWTDRELPPLEHPAALERCRNFGEASDVLRYEILKRFGGVYVDTDVECLRPIDDLVGDATAFAAWARPKVIGSAVVGSVPDHPAITRTLEAVAAGAGSGNQVDATGPVALTRVLQGADDVELFGRETFYPLDYWEIPFAEGEEVDVADAYAIHHWHATWQTRENLMMRTRALMLRARQLKQRERRMRRRHERQMRRAEERKRKLRAALRRERRRSERLRATRWWRLGQRLAKLRGAGNRGSKRT